MAGTTVRDILEAMRLCSPVFAITAASVLVGDVSAAPLQRAPRPRTTIEHVWRPVREGTAGVTAIEVRTLLKDFPLAAGHGLSLNVPITYAGVSGIADRVQRLEVSDTGGAVALRIEDEPPHPGGFPHFRHFRAERDVVFPVSVAYRSLAPTQVVRGPPFGLLAAEGGVSGAGAGFLVLPELSDTVAVTTSVHWDLRDLVPGSTAATTFGVGDFVLTAAPDEIRQGWIMAGPLGRYPARGGPRTFSAFWLGEPRWDTKQEMHWASRMYEYLGRTYAYLKPLPPYRVFIRVAPAGTPGSRSGTALGSSFMAGAELRTEGAAPAGESPRETFTHEMGHRFVGEIDAPLGVGSWFSEGLNTYYTRLLPMRGGFTSVDDYVRDVNRAFTDYYNNPARNLSADSIVRIGFADENVRHMPYVRGSLYFADLDAKIRAHSGSKRNLDVVLHDLFVRRLKGERVDHDAWIRLVVAEAGASAREDFEGVILRGDQTLIPASDAFGPCLERASVEARQASGRTASYVWSRRPLVPDKACRRQAPVTP